MGILKKTKKEDQKDQEPVVKEKIAKTSKKKVDAKKMVPAVSTSAKALAATVIVKPLVTEKSAVLASANQYVFVVSKSANKVQVRSAIKAMYGIMPTRVNMQNVNGKRVRFGRVRGKRKDWKKAIVTLPEGKTINVYEGV
ncbi:50S ribosomal protein L23 [Candidatus Uhrbacteria bacterium]|jgi:large subunit ribosomal protein L23|nr:50S ribosomal protein L23 [Candidatus Uhrbacteria bacterium]